MNTFDRMAGLPMGKIAGAYWALTGNTQTSRSVMQRALADAIDQGRLTLADVRNAPVPGSTPVKAAVQRPVPAFQPPPASAAQASVAATLRADLSSTMQEVQTLAGRCTYLSDKAGALEQSILGVENNVRAADAKVNAVGNLLAQVQAQVQTAAQSAQAEAKSLRAQVQTLTDTIGRVSLPEDELRAAMRQAVQDAWAPIRAAAEANGNEAQVLAEVAGPEGRASALDVFGIDARDRQGRPLMFTTWGHPKAPQVDTCHIWTESNLRLLALAEATGKNLWLAGPAGVGKTQTAEQWAARTGRLYERFVFNRQATVDDFLGSTGIKQGDTEFQPGPILRALQTPGAIGLLDEPGTGSPAAMATLNGLLEGKARVSYADRVWHRATGQIFMGTDNSNGQGDTSGRFAGVQQMNTAFMDRFSYVVQLTYLDPADEAAALVRHTGCTQALADHVVAAFTVARAKVESGDLIDPPTFRQAVAFTQACSILPIAQAWQVSVAARQPMESQVALAAIFAASIDVALIEREAQ